MICFSGISLNKLSNLSFHYINLTVSADRKMPVTRVAPCCLVVVNLVAIRKTVASDGIFKTSIINCISPGQISPFVGYLLTFSFAQNICIDFAVISLICTFHHNKVWRQTWNEENFEEETFQISCLFWASDEFKNWYLSLLNLYRR